MEALIILDTPILELSTLNTNTLTFDKLEDINALNSAIIDRMISNALIGVPAIVTDNALVDPDGDVSKVEMTKFIEAVNTVDDVNTVDEFITFLGCN